MKRTMLIATLAASLAAPALAEKGAKESDGRIQLGYLTCTMADGSNYIVISSKTFDCILDVAEDDMDEKYTLDITSYGVDLSATESQELRWAVLAPSTFEKNGVLEGSYAGASADAAIGYSIGAKALVGGGEDSVALQPVSVTKGEGLGAAVGVERATLTYDGLVQK